MSERNEKVTLPSTGWREWVRLPDLGLPWMKAKVDSGARTSALHAFDIKIFERDGKRFVSFKVPPRQHSLDKAIHTEAELVDQRNVRSSAGRRTFRPVIRTTLEILGESVTAEMTLICREKMKFRMLIGREALQDRFLVDAGQSFLGGSKKRDPDKKKIKKHEGHKKHKEIG